MEEHRPHCLNPAPDRDLQWRGRGYVAPCAPRPAPVYGYDVTPVCFTPCLRSILWIFAVVGFITLLLTLLALAAASRSLGLWHRQTEHRVATNHNVTLNGDLPPIQLPSVLIGSGLYNVSALQFDNNFNGSAAPNARIAVYNPSFQGLRDHGNGSLEILTAREGVLKSALYISQEQRVGVRTRFPRSPLDVQGNITARECYQMGGGLQLACLDKQAGTDLVVLGDPKRSDTILQAKQELSLQVEGAEVLRVDAGGLLVTGLVESTVGFMVASDSRVKREVQTADASAALAHLAALRVVQYEFSAEFSEATGKPAGSKFTGLLAQEAEAVVPQLVHTQPKFKIRGFEMKNFKMLDQGRLLYELLMALQELQERVEALERQK